MFSCKLKLADDVGIDVVLIKYEGHVDGDNPFYLPINGIFQECN